VVVVNYQLTPITADNTLLHAGFQTNKRSITYNGTVPTPIYATTVTGPTRSAPAIKPRLCFIVQWEVLRIKRFHFFAAGTGFC
jgi:hypothetical protein